MNKIILDRWQGLGDNLQISTIPRRLYEKYGEKVVYISDATFYRNPEIRELVWENNPYIAGFTDQPGESKRSVLQIGRYDWIETWERLYGLSEPFSQKPEVYIQKQNDLFGVSSSVVFDISYSEESLKVNESHFPNFLETHKKIIKDFYNQFKHKKIVKVVNPNLTKVSSVDLISLLCPELEVETLEIQNIKDYCNVISNCNEFISTHSGNHSLASALRDSAICIIPRKYFYMKYFVYNNIKYLLV